MSTKKIVDYTPNPKEGGTKKIKSYEDYLKGICHAPEHNPPMHQSFSPGLYEHTCPKCGKKQVFEVSLLTNSINDPIYDDETPDYIKGSIED